MAVFKCKMCGAILNVEANQTVCKCEFCQTTQTVANSSDDERKQELYNRANALRYNSEFDKASLAYQSILGMFPNEAEAHWGLVLSRYGIEYVDDPITKCKKPTIHRMSYESILKDSDYLAALKNADVIAKEEYQREAEEIYNIQMNILSISQKEDPFDIFICYKESDNNGNRTPDSVIAQDIYDHLTNKGYKVFFARITLENKIGKMYEPYIFAALNSVKIMLVIGSKPEYFNAVWVKNEWSRFLDLMQTRPDHYLIPCYKDINAYEMPDEFISFQAQDLNKLGYMQDLTRGIDKLMGRNSNPKPQATTQIIQSDVNVDAMLKRAGLLLEDGNFEKADSLLEKVLNNDAYNAKAYLYKVMVQVKAHTINDLKGHDETFENNHNWQRAYDFGDDEFKGKLNAINQFIISRKEQERLQGIYDIGMGYKDNAMYQDAINSFKEIIGYKDSDTQIKECEQCIKQDIYEQAVNLMNNKSYLEAASKFMDIIDYKDAGSLLEECKRLDKQVKYDHALNIKKAGNYDAAISAFKLIPNFNDVEEQIKDCLFLKEQAKKEKIYQSALFKQSSDPALDKVKINNSLKVLATIEDYKDVKELIVKYEGILKDCNEEIDKRNKEKQERLRKRKKKFKIGALISSGIALLTTGALLLTFLYIIPNNNQNDIAELINDGKYSEALLRLQDQNGLLDTNNLVKMTKAGQAFKSRDYETGIDYVIQTGGTVSVKYNPLIGETGMTDQVISPKPRYITNEAEKEGLTFTGWELKGYDINALEHTANIQLSATYDPITYNITYDLDGGSFEYTPDYTYNILMPLRIPNPIKRGYTFKGWTFLGQEDTPLKDLSFEVDTIVGDKHFTANWVANSYDVHLDSAGGELDKTDYTFTYDETYQLPTPIKLGHKFLGWYLDNRIYPSSGTFRLINDVTLLARWETINYDITYNLDGGTTGDASIPYTYNVLTSKAVPNPSKVGHTFKGWTTNKKDETGLYKNYEIVPGKVGDLILTAHWEANKYKVTLDAGDGALDSGVSNIVEVTYGSDYELPIPFKVGYEFEYWADEQGLPLDDTITWNYTKDVKVIAIYSASTNTRVKVNYYLQNLKDDGYSFVKSEYKTGTSDTRVDFKAPVETGFTPVQASQNIYIKADGSTEVTFYYTRNSYNLTFKSNGGTPVDKRVLKYEEVLPSDVVTSRQGYTFDGWYSESNLTNKFTKMLGSDLTVYAKYKEESSTSLFSYDDSYLGGTRITKYNGNDTDVIIPLYINDKKVDVIGDQAFASSSVISVTFNKNIKHIGFAAFQNCSALETVKDVNSVTSIASVAFKHCASLTNIDEFTSLTSLGGEAFAYCSNMVHFNDGGLISDVGQEVFKECISLLETPDLSNVEKILNGVFMGCSSLTNVKGINIVNNTFKDTFTDCPNLTEMIITIQSNIGQLYLSQHFNSRSATDDYYAAGDMYYNFYAPKTLTKITLRDTRDIPSHFFYRLSSITSLVFERSDIDSVGNEAFRNVDKLADFDFIKGVRRIGDNAFNGCKDLTSLYLAPYLASIGDRAFGNTGLNGTVSLLGNNATIGEGIFENCTEITGLEIPKSNVVNNKLGPAALFGTMPLSGMYSVACGEKIRMVPEGLTKLYVSTGASDNTYFNGLSSITDFTIHNFNGLPRDGVLEGLTNIKTLNIQAVDKPLARLFMGHEFTNSYLIEDGTTLHMRAFVPASLKDIKITCGDVPAYFMYGFRLNSLDLSKANNVYDKALEGLKECNSLTLPGSNMRPMYKYYEQRSSGTANISLLDIHYNPTRFNEITILGSPYIVPQSMFEGIKTLTKVKFSNTSNLNKIEDYAFKDTSIQSFDNDETCLNIPANVKIIGRYAFANSKVSNVKFNDKLNQISEYAFANTKLVNVKLNNQLTTIGNYAFAYIDTLSTINSDLPGHVVIPSCVSTLGVGAIKDATKVTNIDLSKTQCSLSAEIFGVMPNLVELNLGNNTYAEGEFTIGRLFSNGQGMIVGGGLDSNCFVPSNLAKVNVYTPGVIYNNMFANMTSLIEVNLNGGYSEIGSKAFFNCSNLSSINSKNPGTFIISDGVNVIGDHAFYGCEKLSSFNTTSKNTFQAPASIIHIGTKAFGLNTNFEHINLTGGYIENLDTEIFFNNCNVKDLVLQFIPNGGDNFGLAYLFNINGGGEGMQMLNTPSHTCYVPSGITEVTLIDARDIPNYAFAGMTSLTKVTYPENVVIGNHAFDGCSNLTYINSDIPNELNIKSPSVREYAFAGLTNITKITITPDVLNIGFNAFDGCINLKSFNSDKENTIVIPRSLQTTGASMFKGASNIQHIVIENLYTVANNIFDGMENITDIEYSTTYVHSNGIYKLFSYEKYNNNYYKVDGRNYIPNSLKYIKSNAYELGDYEFYGMLSLTKVDLTNTIHSIPNYAFAGCSNLIQLNSNVDDVFNIPNSVIEIGNDAFSQCSSAVDIKMGDSISKIGSYAFSNCYNINRINSDQDGYLNIKDGCLEIGYGAFIQLKNIKYVNIADSVETIEENIFTACPNIVELTIPSIKTNKKFGHIGKLFGEFTLGNNEGFYPATVGNVNYAIPHALTKLTITTQNHFNSKELYGVNTLINIDVPNIDYIGDRVFYGCTSLSTINSVTPHTANLPKVTYIGPEAFVGCNNLTDIQAPKVSSIEENAFADVNLMRFNSSQDHVFNIPEQAIFVDEYAFKNNSNIEVFNMPGVNTAWSDYVLDGCTNIKEVSIGLLQKSSQRLITFANLFSKTNIANTYAANSCYVPNSLTKVTITGPEIPNSCFVDISSVTEYRFDNVVILGESVFSRNTSLAKINSDTVGEVNLPSTLKEIGNFAFRDCLSITTVNNVDSVEKIGEQAFDGCKNITKFNSDQDFTLTLNGSIKSISNFAFKGLNQIKYIEISDTLQFFGHNVFKDCSNVVEVTIPYFTDNSYNNTYSNGFGRIFNDEPCQGMYEGGGYNDYYKYYIPTTLNKVTITRQAVFKNCAFYNTSSLIDLVIPQTTNIIGKFAFANCTNLSTINSATPGEFNIPNGVREICERTFENCNALTKLNAKNIESLESQAINDAPNLKSLNSSKDGEFVFTDYLLEIRSQSLFNLPLMTELTFNSRGLNIYSGGNINNCPNLANMNFAFLEHRLASFFVGGSAPESLTTINVANGIYMPYGTFSQCTYLKYVTIKDQWIDVPSEMFYNCTNLLRVNSDIDGVINLNDSAINIGDLAFANCVNITSINKKDNRFANLGRQCFKDMTNLTSICGEPYRVNMEINGEIQDHAFEGLTSMKYFNISGDPTSIGSEILYQCTSIVELSMPRIGLFGDLFGNALFEGTYNTGVYHIPSSITKVSLTNASSIQSYAFFNAISLIEININDTCSSIGNNAFDGCENLSSMNSETPNTFVLPKSLHSLQTEVFKYCEGMHRLYIGNECTSIDADAYLYAVNLKSVNSDVDFTFNFPEGIETINPTNFKNVKTLKYLSLPSTMNLSVHMLEGLHAIVSLSVSYIPDFEVTNSLTRLFDSQAIEGVNYKALWDFVPLSLKEITVRDQVDFTDTQGLFAFSHIEEVNINPETTVLAPSMFGYIEDLKRVNSDVDGVANVPVNVKVIPGSAFMSDSKLTRINTSNVTAIKNYAFAYCGKLTSINTDELNTIRFADGLTQISEEAFAHLPLLQHVYLPDSVTTIESYVFNGSTNIQDITIPCVPDDPTVGADLNRLARLFGKLDTGSNDNYRVSEFYVPNSFSKVTITKQTVFPDNCFSGLTSLTEINIPTNTTELGAHAFEGNTKLSTMNSPVPGVVNIPDGVSTLKEGVFENCTSIERINTKATKSIDKHAFYNCSSLSKMNSDELNTFIFPVGLQKLDSFALSNIPLMKHVFIDDALTFLGDSIFSKCPNIEDVTIPFCVNNQSERTEYMLSNLFGLAELTGTQNYTISDGYNTFYIPNSFKKITFTSQVIYGIRCFYNFKSLEEINVPDETSIFGMSCFKDTTKLRTMNSEIDGVLNLPHGLANIPTSAFENSNSLQVVNIPSNVQTVGSNAFYTSSGITSVNSMVPGEFILYEGMKHIYPRAFANIDNITSITLPSGTSSVERLAFAQANNVAKLNISNVPFNNDSICKLFYDVYSADQNAAPQIYDSVKEIIVRDQLSFGENAFAYMHGLEKITLPENANSLEVCAFYGCNNLKTMNSSEVGVINIPNNISEIPNSCFYDCKSIVKVNTPTSLSVIRSSAFKNCVNLTTVDSDVPFTVAPREGLTRIESNAFDCNTSIKYITLPKSLEYIGGEIFKNCYNVIELSTPYICKGQEPYYNYPTIARFFNKSTPHLSGMIKGGGTLRDDYVPESLVKVSVTAEENLQENCFYNMPSLVSVSLPKTTQTIGRNAFDECVNLSSFNSEIPGEVILPDNLVELTGGVFAHCNNIVDVKTNPALQIIGGSAFTNCFKLAKFNSSKDKTINVPSTVTKIGSYAFYYLKSVENIIIPDSVTNMDHYIFGHNIGIVNLTIPNVPTYYEYGISTLFDQNSYTEGYLSHTGFYIPKTLNAVTITNDVTLPKNAFKGLHSVTKITLPNNLQTIGHSAFADCDSLVMLNSEVSGLINIPESVTSIDHCAFQNCSAIEDVEFLGAAINNLGNNVFSNCVNLSKVNSNVAGKFIVPDSVTSIGSYTFEGCTSLTNAVINDSVVNLGTYLFDRCVNIAELTTPFMGKDINDTTRTLGTLFRSGSETSGFYYATSSSRNMLVPTALKKVNITKQTIIPKYGFYQMTSLLEVNLNDNVTTISSAAFSDCYYLNKINSEEVGTYNLPLKLEILDVNAFEKNEAVKKVITGNALKEIRGSAFHGCNNLGQFNGSKTGDLVVPEGVSVVGSSAFATAGYITDVVIPNSVTTIGGYFLHLCPNIVNLTVPFVPSVCDTHGISYLFSYDYSETLYSTTNGYYVPKTLESITITNQDVIPDYAFSQIYHIKHINVPSSVTSIGRYAFNECNDLLRVNSDTDGLANIPSGMTSISNLMFYECRAINEVKFLGSNVTSIGRESFGHMDSLSKFNSLKDNTLEVPSSVLTIDAYAFAYSKLIKNVIIDDTLEKVGNCMFGYSTGIEDITIPFYNEDYSAEDGLAHIFTKYSYSLEGINRGGGLSNDCQLPKSLKKITITKQDRFGKYAFYNANNLAEINIPDTTTYIGPHAFESCSKLVTFNSALPNIVNMPSSLTKIDNHAFYHCDALPIVNINSELSYIGSTAFSHCSSIQSFNSETSGEFIMPNSLTYLGDVAFGNNPNIVKAVINDNCANIGRYVFENTPKLKEVILPAIPEVYADVSIGSLFSNNYHEGHTSVYQNYYVPLTLEKITITKQTAFPKNAFRNLGYVKEINVPSETTSFNTNCFNGDIRLEKLNSLTSGEFNIPKNVSVIPSYCFYDNQCATNIKFLGNITRIEDCAFDQCYNITNFNSNEALTLQVPDTCTYLGSLSLGSFRLIKHAYVGENVAEFKPYIFGEAKSLEELVFSAFPTDTYGTLRGVGYLFNGSSFTGGIDAGSDGNSYVPNSLTSVEILTGTEVPRYAFMDMVHLTHVGIPNTIRTISTYAFRNCHRLSSINSSVPGEVILPTALETIKNNAFESCYDIASIKTSAKLTRIDISAFHTCSNLLKFNSDNNFEFNLPSKLEYLGNYAFINVENIQVIKYPDTLTYLGSVVLENCPNVKSITTPILPIDGANDLFSSGYVTGLESTTSSRYVPTSLKEITITKLIDIPKYAFRFMKHVESITIPDNVRSIGAYAFDGCNRLSSLNAVKGSGIYNLPNAVNNIEDYTFQNNQGLVEMHINQNISNIGTAAFRLCSNLMKFNSETIGEFIIPDSVTSVGGAAFNSCSQLKVMHFGINTSKFGSNILGLDTKLEKLYIPCVPEGKTLGYIISSEDTTGMYSVYQGATYYVPETLKEVHVTAMLKLTDNMFKDMQLNCIHLLSGATGETNTFKNCPASINYDVIKNPNGPYLGDGAAASYESGAGSEKDPYIIANPNQLVYFSEQLTYNHYNHTFFKLSHDINLNNVPFNSLKVFEGNFDGNGHRIYNVNLVDSLTSGGFFSHIFYGAKVSYLGLEVNSYTDTSEISSNVAKVKGILTGYNHGIIDNCYVILHSIMEVINDGELYLGGLCGGNMGTITNSFANVSVKGISNIDKVHVGGLVGGNDTIIQNSFAIGNVSAHGLTLAFTDFGGLVGSNTNSEPSTVEITNSFFTSEAKVTGYNNNSEGINDIGSKDSLINILKIMQPIYGERWDFTHTYPCFA